MPENEHYEQGERHKPVYPEEDPEFVTYKPKSERKNKKIGLGIVTIVCIFIIGYLKLCAMCLVSYHLCRLSLELQSNIFYY
jgi:hypothetical protein